MLRYQRSCWYLFLFLGVKAQYITPVIQSFIYFFGLQEVLAVFHYISNTLIFCTLRELGCLSLYYHSYATFHGTNVPRLLLWLVVVCLSPLSNYIFQRILSISWQNYAVGVLFLIFSYLYLSKGVNRRASFYSKKIATKCHVSSLPHGNSLLPC